MPGEPETKAESDYLTCNSDYPNDTERIGHFQSLDGIREKVW